jgi:hypothetical protein
VGSQLKRIRRQTRGGSPAQVARALVPYQSAIARNRAWAEGVIAAHETEVAARRWERRGWIALAALFLLGVAAAALKGCG